MIYLYIYLRYWGRLILINYSGNLKGIRILRYCKRLISINLRILRCN